VVAQAPARQTRSRGVLTVSSGADAGRVLSVPRGGVLTLGRADDCAARFDDVSLSRVHARVMRIGGEFVLDDAGSTNGSYVNDARVAGPTPLKDGDRVQLGSSTMLRFSLVDEAEEAALKQVFEAARRDGLTGIANRKHLEERLDAEVAYAARHGSPLSLVIFDVDFFKRVNDTFGHPAGDLVLRSVAGVLAAGLRTEDFVARFGGEEFVVVARGIELMGACLLADRLRMQVSQTPMPVGPQPIWVTTSAGVASLACTGPTRDKAALLSIADQRLYAAKQSGRNRVIGAG
jgi:diguanylate cyclase (GGDEF)-like protein